MRKLISAILVLMMIFASGFTGAQAEQYDFLIGDWTIEYSYGGMVIAEQAVFIYDNNSFEITDEGQSEKGTWTFDGSTLVLSGGGEVLSLKWDAGAHQMVGDFNGMSVILRMPVDRTNGEATATTGMLAGGWAVSEDPAITPEIEQMLWTALDSYQTGTIAVSYTPIAYLGSQVVAGTNHAILCRASEINKGTSWVIIYLYEDLQRNVTVMNIANFDFGSLCTYGAG